MESIIFFESQLSTLEAELFELQQQLKEKKELRKAIAQKKVAVEKVILNFENAIAKLKETFDELGEVADSYKAIAFKKAQEIFSDIVNPFSVPDQELTVLQEDAMPKETFGISAVRESESVLVDFPKQENKSNEAYAWQLTSNNLLAYYTDNNTGKIQTAYIGSNNKNKLKSLISNLAKILPGVSGEIRKAKRSPCKYELKLWGLQDNDLGWLSEFDFNSDFAPQFSYDFKAFGEPLAEDVAPGIEIKNRYHDYCCTLIENRSLGLGKVATKDGKIFDIYLNEWTTVEVASSPHSRVNKELVASFSSFNSSTDSEYSEEPSLLATSYLSEAVLATSEESTTLTPTTEDDMDWEELGTRVKYNSKKSQIAIALPNQEVAKAWQAKLKEEQIKTNIKIADGKVCLWGKLPKGRAIEISSKYDFADPYTEWAIQSLGFFPDEPIQVNYADVVTDSDILMKAIGWSVEQGRKYLTAKYGKRSRLYLDDRELFEFTNYLRSLYDLKQKNEKEKQKNAS